MKKYLKELEYSGMILLLMSIIFARLNYPTLAMWLAFIGLLLWVVSVIYKALDWKTYRHDNLVNIAIMLIAIFLILLSFFYLK